MTVREMFCQLMFLVPGPRVQLHFKLELGGGPVGGRRLWGAVEMSRTMKIELI